MGEPNRSHGIGARTQIVERWSEGQEVDEGQRLLGDGCSKPEEPEEDNLSCISRIAVDRCRNKLQGDLSSPSIFFSKHIS